MTDTMPEQATENDWEPHAPDEGYPEYPGNPHNHRFTISMNGQGPMIVVRGNTAEEVNEGFQELEEAATGAAIGNAWASIKAAAAVANGAGPATPVQAPQGPPAPPQAPQSPGTPPPFGPNVSAPQAPGYQGPPTPPAPPQQNGGGAQDRRPEYQQAGWYKVNVPWPKKGEFDGIAAQYQMQKGRPTENGHFSFNKADKSWYVHPQYAGAFPQFNPVPA